MGRLSVPFGVHGWVKLRAYTELPGGLGQFPHWWLKTREGWRAFELEDFAVRPGAANAKLAGIDDREAAEALKGCEIAVPRAELGEADEGSIYWADLIGLEVANLQGEALGKVQELFRTGETSVLVVRGERERMIPFVGAYVKSVDRESGRITVDWGADY
jgi:16S rRNA processing protein RimM